MITALRGEDGRLVGFGKVTRDLTERKRGEEMLRQSEERFRLLVSSVADYAIFLLEPDGTVASWNLGAEHLKGYRADEIIGHHVSQFYTDEDRRAGVPAMALRQALDEGRWESEGWRVRKDGSRFWANVLLTSLRGADGSHRGYAKVTRDLTERKRNEDALRGVLARERDASARLRELDQMRGELVAVIAHDLRAPVGVIEHIAHRLGVEWDTLSEDDKRDAFDRIGARAAMLASLVDDVFDMVLIDGGRLEIAAIPFDVGAVVADAVADIEASANPRSITTVVEPDARALGDVRRTLQVLSNLLSNAMKFSEPGTPIVVSVERKDGEIAVAVSDAGVRHPRRSAAPPVPALHPAEHQQRDARQWCRALHRQVPRRGPARPHQRRIDPRYRHHLPLHAAQRAVKSAPEGQQSSMPTLIVDDDAEQRRLVRALIERAGLGPVHEAASAEDALAVAAREELALVVLDLVMPGRTGLDVLPDLHELVPGASIVVLSNLPRHRVGDVALSCGATGYVEKRVAPERLVTEILIAAAVAAVTAERVSVRLPAAPAAARTARGLVRDALSSVDNELLSSIELLVSELVTNTVLHTSSGARLDVHVNRATIRVEVFDEDATLPELRMPDDHETGGRGLQLVDHIASRWGSEPQRDGKVVWFEIDRTPSL